MSAKKCEFEGCDEKARKGWRYCRLHIQVMYRRMLDDGYLEPWPGGKEPGGPQDLVGWKEKNGDDGEAATPGDPACIRHAS